jgi:flavorubredoxin
MYNIRKLENDLTYIGCSDRTLDLFESAYPVKNGVSYNSYLLNDEKTVLFDTVDKSCEIQFLQNLAAALGNKLLDYIVVHHMEPDHAALLETILRLYPQAKIVCTAKAQAMIKQFFDFENEPQYLIVKDNDSLNTGKHELKFLMAPMVHWPEVMVTYDSSSKSLFAADAFGSFGAINGNLYDDEVDWKSEYLDEARRYYTNIVGKYGLQVQMLLKKAAGLDIKTIYPLHGLIIRENINVFVEKYNQWSTYTPEENGVLIVYSSVYGGTENVLNILATKLAENNIKRIKMYDISRADQSIVLSEAFKYSHIILGSTTYNANIFESMSAFIDTLVSHNLQNRKFVLVENGSWAPTCAGLMKTKLEKLKNSEFLNETFCIKSTLKECQIEELNNVVNTIVNSINL